MNHDPFNIDSKSTLKVVNKTVNRPNKNATITN